MTFTSPVHCYFIVLGTETMNYLSPGKPCNLLILYQLHSDVALIFFFFSSLPFSLQIAHRHRQGVSLAMISAWLVYFLPLLKCLWLNTGFFSSPWCSGERRERHNPGIKGSVTVVLAYPSCRKPCPLLSDDPSCNTPHAGGPQTKALNTTPSALSSSLTGEQERKEPWKITERTVSYVF